MGRLAAQSCPPVRLFQQSGRPQQWRRRRTLRLGWMCGAPLRRRMRTGQGHQPQCLKRHMLYHSEPAEHATYLPARQAWNLHQLLCRQWQLQEPLALAAWRMARQACRAPWAAQVQRQPCAAAAQQAAAVGPQRWRAAALAGAVGRHHPAQVRRQESREGRWESTDLVARFRQLDQQLKHSPPCSVWEGVLAGMGWQGAAAAGRARLDAPAHVGCAAWLQPVSFCAGQCAQQLAMHEHCTSMRPS